MRFVEETGAAWTAEQLRAAEEEIEAQKREWEANRLAALQKEEEMLKKEAEADEMLTYNRKDATNQVNNKIQGTTIRTKTMIKTNRRVLKQQQRQQQQQQQQRLGRGGKVVRLGRGENSSSCQGVKRAAETRTNSVLEKRSPLKNRRGAGNQSLRGRAVGSIRINNVVSYTGSSRSRGNSVEHEKVARWGNAGNARATAATKRASSPTASDEAEEETATTTNTMKSTRKTTRTSMAAAAIAVNADTDDDDEEAETNNTKCNKRGVVGTKRNATGVKNQSLLNRRRLLQQRKEHKVTAAANMRKRKISDRVTKAPIPSVKRKAVEENRELDRSTGKRRQLRSSPQKYANKARLRTYSHKQSEDEENDMDEDDGEEDDEEMEEDEEEDEEEAVATANDDEEEEVEQTATESERSDNEKETVEEDESADEVEETADTAVSANDDTENEGNQYDSVRSHSSDDAEEQSEAEESEEVEPEQEQQQERAELSVSKTERTKVTLRKNAPVIYYTPRRKYNSRTSNISPPPQAVANDEENNSDCADEDDSENYDAASYVTVLDTVEDIDDELYESEHAECDIGNGSESETEKAEAHATHAYANERQRRRRNDSDAPTNSNSLDVWNAHTQIHDTTTTNSTYYNVSDETDSEENETPLARLHHTTASGTKRGAAALGNLSTVSKTAAPTANAMHQNHVDVNSPRTRSRGAVKINLWTLDVSPVLPAVSRMTKKQRSRVSTTKDTNATAHSSIKEQLEETEDMMTSTASAEEEHLMDSDVENATSNHKTKLAHVAPTAATVSRPNRNAHLTKSTKRTNAVVQRKRLPKTRVAAANIRSGTTTLHRWLLKTPKSTTTRAADMDAASDIDEHDAAHVSDLLDPLADNRALSSVHSATPHKAANRSSNGPT